MTSTTAKVRVKVKAYKKAIIEFHDALAALRDRITDIKSEIAMVEQAAPSLEEVEAKIDQWIAQRASNWDCLGRTFATATGTGPTVDYDPFRASDVHEVNRLPLALCALVPERIKAAMMGDARAALDVAPMQLTAPERHEKLQQLRSDLFAMEVDEERMICDAEEAGLDVDRRPDADPRAVLAVDDQPEGDGDEAADDDAALIDRIAGDDQRLRNQLIRATKEDDD
ncbi:hypothetical protein [Oceanibaculum indicum]|uniref:Uncharacterized protein n=1 Tax=Oceanibaculum indicum TaxID=526216 RepID=A0A420WR13_9PROT|nr:hypothetical protein [Oceanibaculum indicum]RKQ73487.1 hypothetical protein BCL74_1276 [Oceanibaculum indicum]